MKQVKIEGAIAQVMGANRGMGRALSEALLSRGVKKIDATSRDASGPSAPRDAIPKSGAKALRPESRKE
jgi:NAD(P)-dependent dehydrogenase (short-subunit alcohol dehydrogenase family)